jgi:hypothetical protein
MAGKANAQRAARKHKRRGGRAFFIFHDFFKFFLVGFGRIYSDLLAFRRISQVPVRSCPGLPGRAKIARLGRPLVRSNHDGEFFIWLYSLIFTDIHRYSQGLNRRRFSHGRRIGEGRKGRCAIRLRYASAVAGLWRDKSTRQGWPRGCPGERGLKRSGTEPGRLCHDGRVTA